MSRAKLRGGMEQCADCSLPEPTWVSVNRGILICEECCTVHRSLGRHVSQVKSLKKGLWSPTQLAMVHALYNNGANSIWEHSLLDPTNTKSGRRKPNPKDPIHPTKADFIRAKHQTLAFVYRPGKEDPAFAEGDVSKQLHSSVRTGNLETSLRLLSLGADANYFHTEKGTCPIHVAAQAGQVSQVELLIIYGADPGAYDAIGKTPIDYARVHHHDDLADRLVELQFELTDCLAHYLCGRKPDHRAGPHFIIPEMADSLDKSELAKAAKKKLQLLPNTLFEELGVDIYDEVDRRETDAVWLSTQNQSALVADRYAVPFLPVNPEFSSTRNQGRQKLARFNAREFATLIIDFLCDAKRRQMGLPVVAASHRDSKDSLLSHRSMPRTKRTGGPRARGKSTGSSDDEPLYDSVASDEENLLGQPRMPCLQAERMAKAEPNSKHLEKTPDVIAEASTVSPQRTVSAIYPVPEKSRLVALEHRNPSKNVPSQEPACNPISVEAYMDVKQQLATSQAQIQQLLHNNTTMKQEISLLQNMGMILLHRRFQLQKLVNENTSLRVQVQPAPPVSNGHESVATLPQVQRSPRSSQRPLVQRPQSMYEPRQYQQTWPPNPHGVLSKQDEALKCSRGRKSSGDSERSVVIAENYRIPIRSRGTRWTPLTSSLCLPSQDDVVKKTERITKRIQELLISAQEGRHESFIPCSEKIYEAVLEMVKIFPQDCEEDTIGTQVCQLTTSALRLQTECRTLLGPLLATSVDPCFVTQQVIQCAYDVAKAAKQLVTTFQ